MMHSEQDMIRMICSAIPSGPDRANRLYESDAETVYRNGEFLLFSMDDFSPEDLFLTHDPFILGWNCTAGTLSDIAAAGGIPLWYMHSMTVPGSWPEEYIKMFSQGIASALHKAGASFLGGDFSRGPIWHYTGSAAGTSETSPLMRTGAQQGDRIYITGPAGDGNVQAALSLMQDSNHISKVSVPKFRIRMSEGRLLKTFASSCIDTSDGLFSGLNTVADINNTGYSIESVPYSEQCRETAQALSLPTDIFFFGECGEYELLCTVPPEREKEMLVQARANSLEFLKIGAVADPDTRILLTDGKKIDLQNFSIHARDYDNIHEYTDKLCSLLKGKV